MVQFSRILCPFDFSDTSRRALGHAVAFSRWYGAELLVTHVMPETLEMFAWAPDVARELRPASPERVLTALGEAVAGSGAGREPRLILKQGYADEQIVSLAREEDASLIVLGTHGRRGFSHLFLGSVTEKVIRTASCPVLTVPPAAPAAVAAPIRFLKILCPTDGSAAARKALDYALELGREAGGKVTVLRVLEYMDPMESSAIVDPAVRAYRRQVIAEAHERLHASLPAAPETWCEVEEVVALNINRASHEILQRARDSQADLIVMGTQGSGGLDLMMYGSNTHHVVRGAACPVLTVRG